MKFTLLFIVLFCGFINRPVEAEEQSNGETEPDLNQDDPNNVYVSPQVSGDACYLAENFDSGNIDVFKSRWIRSDAKKEDVDEDIAKYDGEWNIEAGVENSLNGDLGLALKSKAKHHAVSAFLNKPFRFNSKKPIIIQYDVRFQEGMECGGAYIKLISEGGIDQLTEFHDKTPYTIMFGPDKCGNDHKLHFIFRYKSPKSENYEEKHMAMPETESFKHIFTDKNSHLLTLTIEPESSFEVSLDQTVIKSGSLLKDFSPSVVPAAEIDDPEDKKPEDWDERAKIADPEAKKPEDWDENEPEKIVDPEDSKPEGWLEDEPSYIPDPQAVKPSDWDVDIDGEWEAPLIENPRCKPGCGEWKPAMIANPKFKGKWYAPQIDNPNYQGVWKPKKIANPDYFEDNNPFENLAAIRALGLELWSMSSEILFDNFLITSDSEMAVQYAANTWQKKKLREQNGFAASDSVIDFLYKSANQNPWLWIVYALVVILPITCCASYMLSKPKKRKSKSSKTATPAASAKPEESPATTEANPRVNTSSRDQLEVAEEAEEEEAGPGPRGDEASAAGDVPEQPSAKPSLPEDQAADTVASVTVSSKGDLESREEEEEGGEEVEESDDDNEEEGEEEEGSDVADSDDEDEDDNGEEETGEDESAIDGDDNSQSPETTNLEAPAESVVEERTQPRQRKSRKD